MKTTQCLAWLWAMLLFLPLAAPAQVSVETIGRTGSSLTYRVTTATAGDLTVSGISQSPHFPMTFTAPVHRRLDAGSDTVEVPGLRDSMPYLLVFSLVSGADTGNMLLNDTTLAVLGTLPPAVDTAFIHSCTPFYVYMEGSVDVAGTSLTAVKGFVSARGPRPPDGYHRAYLGYLVGTDTASVTIGCWIEGVERIPAEDTLYFFFVAENHVGSDTSDVLAFSTGEGLIRRYPPDVLRETPTGTAMPDAAPLAAYPNPTDGSVLLEGVRPEDGYTVYDMHGRAVGGGAGPKAEVGGLRPGTYLIAVEAAGRPPRVARVVVR